MAGGDTRGKPRTAPDVWLPKQWLCRGALPRQRKGHPSTALYSACDARRPRGRFRRRDGGSGSLRVASTGGIHRMTDAEKTVLLVEDNEDNRTVYRTILEHFGYHVAEA